MDRLDRLRAFILVAEHASFAAAARELRLSPAATSRAVASLEDSLGAQLLRRTTRSVRLTDEGAAYLHRARKALADLEDAARLVVGEDAEPQGRLIISAPVVFGRLHVVPIVADLIPRFPRLDIELTLTDRVIRLVDEGVDAAIRIGELPDSALRAVHLGDVRRILVASPAYLAARGAPAAITQLRAHDLIAFEQLSQNDEWRLGPGALHVVRLRPRLRTNSVDAAIAAAILGCGIARTLDYQVRQPISDGRLVQVLPDLPHAGSPISLVHAADRHPSPSVRALVAAARAHFKSAALLPESSLPWRSV